MSVSDEIRAELDAVEQKQAQEAAAQAQMDAALQVKPDRFADPTDDHIDYFNFTESRGFLTTFLETILVNFGPNPDNEAALQRDLYFNVAGFTKSDPADELRMEFASIADTNAPPPSGRTSDLTEKIASVSNFSRGNGRQVDAVYESFDEIYGERLAGAARDMQSGFARAASNADLAQAQIAENNYAPGLAAPVV